MGNRRATSASGQFQAPKFPRDAWALRAITESGVLAAFAADALAREEGEWLASAAIKLGADAARLTAVMAKAAHVVVADLAHADPAAVHFIPENLSRQYAALPLTATNRLIRVATANPMDLDAEQSFGFVAGRQVELLYALPEPIQKRVDEMYRPERSIERLVDGLGTSGTVESLAEEAKVYDTGTAVEAPVAKLIDATISDAVRERASDVHFEPYEQGLIVRYRVDGVLREVMRIPRSAAGALVRRLKVVAKLDVSDPLHPHDGRASARVDGKPWDLRVSSIPVARYGEKVVVRLLDPTSGIAPLTGLGLWPDELATLEALLRNREGIVLVTGPTGSGKTTTLYSALDRIRSTGINVVTVEDPVEYQMAGVNQIQVNEKQGFTFAGALRSVLRQDPNVILLGEIRDEETAKTAWQAGLSGHFVLSTLHTNDALSSLARLTDLGVEPYKIATALKGVVAQRLLRRLCPKCALPSTADALPPHTRPPIDFDRPVRVLLASKGCTECAFTGYRGRVAIEEILTVDSSVADAIARGTFGEAILTAARLAGMRTLFEAGMRRVWVGETTYEEVFRVIGETTSRAAADAPAALAAPAPPPPGAAPPAAAPAIAPIATTSRVAPRPPAAVPAVTPPAPPPAEATDTSPWSRTVPEVTAAAAEPAAAPLVLVADDDPAMRALVHAILTTQGLRVAEAADGITALDEAQRLRPALILLDMDMPRLDGLGVLETLRKRLLGRSTPVIVVTARDDAAIESRCIELGAEDYITKPIQPASLVARTRAVLRRAGVN
jgi:type II secretory ATPase GspE/PulE/Tfp pilus assembly ATPase PilB-like protein/ActR/RegA family two-component response regulator